MARLRGDRTAELAGRLSLNPWRHVDILGTIILPIVGALSQLPVIGWAKPVPVDTRQLYNPRWDSVLVSAAGPASNLLMAFLAVVATVVVGDNPGIVVDLLQALIWVNAFLAVFNLLPLPPLDGAGVAAAILPEKLALRYERLVAPYGYFILMALVASGSLRWLPGVAAVYVEALFGLVKLVI